MKNRKSRSVIPLILIALLLPVFGFTAHKTWTILRQSDSEQNSFEALATLVSAGSVEAVPAADTREANALSQEEKTPLSVRGEVNTLPQEQETPPYASGEAAKPVGSENSRGPEGDPIAMESEDTSGESGEAVPAADNREANTLPQEEETPLSVRGEETKPVENENPPSDPEGDPIAKESEDAGGEAGETVPTAKVSTNAPNTSAPVEGRREPDNTPAQTISGGERQILPRYQAIHSQNPDFFGWVRIDDTMVNYPVMFTPKDPERYLHRDFYGQYSYSGTPFIEGNCLEDGHYYIIYAHHMKNGTMFGGLPQYADRAYWEAHPVICFDTLYEQREYQVLAAFRSQVYVKKRSGQFRYYEFTCLEDEESFTEYMQGVKKVALYDTGVSAAYGDEILALSTCDYHVNDGRFVVVAKRIENEGNDR